MKLTVNIKNNNIEGKIYFNSYGNIYIELNKNTYKIYIDKNNVPYGENVNDKFSKPYNNIQKFILRNDNMLSRKIKGIISINCFREDDEYIDINKNNDSYMINEDVTDMYGMQNIEFNFTKLDSHNKEINVYQYEDVCALYDTYLYENGKLIFVSKSYNNSSLFRINIHNNGYIYIRSIGDEDRKYNLEYRENKIHFV